MAIDKRLQKLLTDYDSHCRFIASTIAAKKSETPEQKRARIKNLEEDYIRWFEYYFENFAQVKSAWYHADFAKRTIENKEIYELLEIFRSGAKSVHAAMGIPLYLKFTGRMRFMLLIGENEKKAKQLLSACQAQLQHNQRIINDYGVQFQAGDWADGSFLTVDGVRFMALGFGQDPRGVREGADRPDYINVDDVDTRKHVNNDRMMREGVEWITGDLIGCFNEMEGATKRFVYSNNNFHKNGITNRLKQAFKALIKKARQEGYKPVHHVLTVPAVKDLNTFEPNWPEKTSAQYWRKKFNSTPYRSFMREYMHKHIEDGNVFKLEDMQWKEMLPYDKYDALVFYGDLSYKTAACFKGMILTGQIGREKHIIHTFLRQSTRPLLAKWLYDLYEDNHLKKAYRLRYWIEGLFAMDEFVNDFDTEGDDRGYYIPVKADKRPKADKYDRIEASQSFFERRNVFFNIREKETADQIELVDQYLAFEKGGDGAVDGPDAVEGGFSKLNIRVHKSNSKFRSAARTSRRY